MPRYIVKSYEFKCADESGSDWWGSDEPYWVVISVCDSASTAQTFRSSTQGDVDTGDRRKPFPRERRQNVLWPTHRAKRGAEGPVCLSIQLWEHDNGNPDKICAKVEKAFKTAEDVPLMGEFVEAVPDIVREWAKGALSDDLMGSQTILIPASRLERKLTRAGQSLRQKFHFSGKSGDLPFNLGGSADYDLWLDIVRTRDDGTYEDLWGGQPASGAGGSTSRSDDVGTSRM